MWHIYFNDTKVTQSGSCGILIQSSWFFVEGNSELINLQFASIKSQSFCVKNIDKTLLLFKKKSVS